MNQTLVSLNPNYSTTRQVTRQQPQFENRSDDKFESVLFLPQGDGRQGEGGLRTLGYFKTSLPDQPLITVVTVVFNGEEFLEETIQSVINQAYANVEYLFIDGGSTDGTLDIIRKYEYAIDYWISEKDSGIYDAMNKGIGLASGDWINFMNAGDCFYNSEVINNLYKYDDHADVQIIFGNHQVRYSSGRERFVTAGMVENLYRGSQFCHQATFVNARYHKFNTFNFHTKIVADFEFFYTAWKNEAIFKFVPETISLCEAGGISDLKRIDSIVGWWNVVDKNRRVNMFYIFIICKELIKGIIKNKI
jgi:glycosyltransferase involved in cell wall biosynthesis